MRRECKMKDGKEDSEGEEEMKYSGSVQCSLRIYPKAAADKAKQGEGREAPNNDPFMPEPEGRFKLSLNPFAMLSQLVGPALVRKIYCACCCAICCTVLGMMAPMIISNIVASWFTPGPSYPTPAPAAPAPAPAPAPKPAP